MDSLLYLYLVFLWIFMSVVNGVIADAKGRNTAVMFFGSLLICPLVIWMYLIAMPAQPKAADPYATQ